MMGLRPRVEREDVVPSHEGHHGSDVSHDSMGALSIINHRLWDEADWRGTMFAYDEHGRTPPVLALAFQNAAAAEEIFAEWRERFGNEDPNNAIRVVIVQGISKANPAAYRVGIYANPESKVFKGKSFFTNVMRSKTLEDATGGPLRIFLDQYGNTGAFRLTFATPLDMNAPVQVDKAIVKHDLIFREAWSIGPNEVDTVMIQAGDDPFIPEGKIDPPVTATLAHRRASGTEESRSPF